MATFPSIRAPARHRISPRPAQTAPWKWLNEWEVEAYVSDNSRSGFHGGIHRYLVADINGEYRKRRGHSVSSVPLYFAASEVDVALAEKYGEGLPAQLLQNQNDVRALRAVSGGVYLLAMERPREVNEAFIDFLRDLDRRGQPSEVPDTNNLIPLWMCTDFWQDRGPGRKRKAAIGPELLGADCRTSRTCQEHGRLRRGDGQSVPFGNRIARTGVIQRQVVAVRLQYAVRAGVDGVHAFVAMSAPTGHRMVLLDSVD